jgi:L-alanine-DL-glutamate epimerase-like enolase superfamily enzyme
MVRSRHDIAIWKFAVKGRQQPVFRLHARPTRFSLRQPLCNQPLDEQGSEEVQGRGYRAMKLRFGWGPVDGAGAQQPASAHGARGLAMRSF